MIKPYDDNGDRENKETDTHTHLNKKLTNYIDLKSYRSILIVSYTMHAPQFD